MGGGLARRRTPRDVARPDLRARQRLRQRLRQRDDPLRHARHGHRAAGAGGFPDAEGPCPCRPPRLRLRPRLTLGLLIRSADRILENRLSATSAKGLATRRWLAIPATAASPAARRFRGR